MRKPLNILLAAAISATTLFGVSGTAMAINYPPGARLIPPYERGTCANADTSARSLTQYDAEMAVICLTNVERRANGLWNLWPDGALTNAGLGHSSDIVANNITNDPGCTPDPRSPESGANPYFTWDCVHRGSNGSWPEDRIWAAGYGTFSPLGENVYYGLGAGYDTPRAAVSWWMNSTGHRAAILNANFSWTGVGVVSGTPNDPGNGATFTEDFGG